MMMGDTLEFSLPRVATTMQVVSHQLGDIKLL